MGILSLFDTCGYLFGPAIMAAGVLALGLCLRASLRSSRPRMRRIAAAFSLLPVALGICGALVGLAVWHTTAQPGGNASENWLALGKVCLAGLVVSPLPFLWSLLLLRRRGMASE